MAVVYKVCRPRLSFGEELLLSNTSLLMGETLVNFVLVQVLDDEVSMSQCEALLVKHCLQLFVAGSCW